MKQKTIFKAPSEIILGCICVISIMGNYMIQGITCNDEVQLRLWGQQGLDTFFSNQIIQEGIQKGRILGFLGNVKFLGYISDNVYVFRGIEMLFLLSAVALMALLAFKILNNLSFSIVLCIGLLAFLPITFEPSVPNAFIIVTTQPLILLLLSLIFWLEYLSDSRKRFKLVVSLLLLFWGMCLYEFVITYVLLFPAIYILKKGERVNVAPEKLFDTCKKCTPVIVVTGVYLAIYVLQGIIAPTSYSGNQVSITSISAVTNVIIAQCISAFPGYYLINEKYRYLFNQYATKDLLNYVSIIVFFGTFLYILLFNFSNSANRQFPRHKKILILLIAFAYTLIPTLPNAITSLYQEAVASGNFLSIPVSLNLYFAMMFFLTYLAWEVSQAIHKKIFTYSIVLIAVFVATNVQIHNRVFAKVQERDYRRFTQIEKLLESDYWNQYSGLTIYAPSLFETRNALAIEADHWKSYASLYQHTLNITGEQDESEATKSLYLEMQADNSFYLYSENSLNIYIDSDSQESIGSMRVLADVNKNERAFEISECIWQWENFKFYELKSYDRE